MANSNAPRGLIPYKMSVAAAFNGAANIYYLASGSLYVGDPVIPTGTSDANGIPGVTLATAGAGNYLLGSMISIVAGGQPVIPVLQNDPVYATGPQYILVADDPNTIFEVQDNGTIGADGSMANVDLVSGSGSTVTGYSGWQLNAATPAGTGNTLQMRLLRPLPQEDNDVTTANAKWLTRINLHSLTNLTGV